MNDPVFKLGEAVTCRINNGYAFTEGKTYVVVGYDPPYPTDNFTFPVYVAVIDDNGRESWCHAYRFQKVAA